MAGLYFEDFIVGQVVETRGLTITEAHVVAYAGLSGDFNPLHTDETTAATTPYGTRVAHGQLGMAMAAGLVNQTGRYEGTTLALLGYREWNFLKPIHFGDTIRVRLTIEEKRETSKPDRGVLLHKVEILNQRDEVIQSGFTNVLVRRRA